MNAISPFLGRLVAIFLAWVCGHLADRYHIFVSTEQQAQLADMIVNVIAGFLTVYAVSHKWMNKFINPGDAASSHLAAEEKTQTSVLKFKDARRR